MKTQAFSATCNAASRIEPTANLTKYIIIMGIEKKRKSVRTKNITIRFTPAEFLEIQGKANDSSLSLSNYIRQACLVSSVIKVDTLTEETRQLIAENIKLINLIREYKINFENIKNFMKSETMRTFYTEQIYKEMERNTNFLAKMIEKNYDSEK